jgi:hypothetical protein
MCKIGKPCVATKGMCVHEKMMAGLVMVIALGGIAHWGFHWVLGAGRSGQELRYEPLRRQRRTAKRISGMIRPRTSVTRRNRRNFRERLLLRRRTIRVSMYPATASFKPICRCAIKRQSLHPPTHALEQARFGESG